MPTIKGFSTKKDLVSQFKDAGVEVTLPFSGEVKASENPLSGLEVKSPEGEKIEITVE